MYLSKPSEPAGAAPVTGIPVGGPGPAAASQWSSGLFDCFDDCSLCCLTLWCPCITFGRVAEIVDRGTTSWETAGVIYTVLACVAWLQWIYSSTYRTKMRAQFGLPEKPCWDCYVHLCCEPCSFCQQYKELRARGFDPALGWDLNAAQHGGAAAAAMHPPAAQGMGR